MKRSARRLLTLLLCACLITGLLPVTAWAAFPQKFYASVNYKYSSYSKSEIFGTVTQSSSGTLTYNEFGEKTDRVVYGMEYAGGVFYTVEGTKLNKNADDGFRELRMYNSSLTSYRTIGTVNEEGGGYWIIDTAMDISGAEPVLYGTYNGYALIGGDVAYCSSICQISLTDGKTSNWKTVTGIPDTDIIYAMAFNKNGTLYAISADMGDNGGPATLYTIDTASGEATKVGEIEDSSDKKISTNWIQDLAFDHATDTLYWAENDDNVLYTVDTENAVATSVGRVSYALQSFCIPYDAAFGQGKDKHMISVICEGAGTVTGGDENKTFYMVENGGSITLTLTPDAGSGLRYVKVDGRNMSTAGLVENGYAFNNVTENHVIEVGFKLAIPATQKTIWWFHYQGEPASFYTQHHVYKFFELPNRINPSLDDVPREGYIQTLLDENGQAIPDNEIILPGKYDVHVTHPGDDKYAAMDVVYKDALDLGKCPGTPGRPVVYGKVGCKQGDLATTSALQDYYGTDGKLIDAAHDEIPVTLVWQNPETTYNEVGNFYASATIYAGKLSEHILACYNDDEGNQLYEGKQISSRATQVVVLPADEASLIKVQASDASGGTVSGKGVYKNGDQVTVTATVNADAGYEFKGWQENGQVVSGAGETYTFEASGDRTLTALFEVDEDYRVTLQTDPQGGGTVTGGGSYEDEPHSATVKATPNQGYYFIGWYKDGQTEAVSTDAEHTFTVDVNGITLTAKFGIDYLSRAEQAQTNFASAVSTDAFEWQTLVQAVEAYEAAEDFVSDPPGVIENAKDRYDALTTYYNSVDTLDLSAQNISSVDLEKLTLFTGVTDLNLSGNRGVTDLTDLPTMSLKTLDLSGTGVSDLSSLSSLTALETLNLSNTGVSDLSSLTGLTALETLNLSGNRGISDLSGLKSLANLETLDISNTGVTTLDSLVTDGQSTFPGYQTLTAQNLSLTSLSVLVDVINAEGFSADSVTKWDFTGSTLSDTEGSRADVETIQEKLNVEAQKFFPPTIQTTPVIPEEPVGGGSTGGSSGYPISVPASSSIRGGSITVSPRSADEGDTVTITVKPDTGYELDTLTAADSKGSALKLTDKGSGKYTFTMPASRVSVSVTFQPVETAPVNPFTDVSTSAYYYDAVLWAVANGVTNGTSATTFSPDMTLTRAQMVTFLWRSHGSPKATGSNPFTDVSAGAYYYDAVLWAVANGITTGTSATAFSPDAPVTRAQAVTFQWRTAGSPAVSGGSFADVAADAYYASAVTWAADSGITVGTNAAGTLFSPDTVVTRAQAVTFLYRHMAQY